MLLEHLVYLANPLGRQNYWDESDTPDPVGHKFSDSHSSLSSFASWKSRSHSRMSSVTTLSGVHSHRQSEAELPSLETTLSSCSDSHRRLSSARKAHQSTSTRPLPCYQHVEMTAPVRPGSPSDAVLNMNHANRPHMVASSARLVLRKTLSHFDLLPFLIWL